MTDRTVWSRHAALATALAGSMITFSQASAQDRDLDREPSSGKVFRGEIGESGEPASFLLTLRGGQGVEVTAAQVAGSDPYLRVFDAGSEELIAENDDAGGTLSAATRLYSETDRRVRIEVTSAAPAESSGPARFELILRPSNYRPRPPLEIALGQTVGGSLESEDEQLYRFHAERGQVWTISMNQGEESGLDPVLDVYAGNAPTGEALASDDDGGGGLDARVRFAVPRTGDYVVRARGVSPSAGAYTLTAGSGQPADTRPREIALGRAATGRLDADTPEQLYRLGAQALTVLAANPGSLLVELHSSSDDAALDPVLDVGFETPLGFSSLLNDDDGGGGVDARLVFDTSTLDRTWLESLRIKASAFSGTSGGYELTVTQDETE